MKLNKKYLIDHKFLISNTFYGKCIKSFDIYNIYHIEENIIYKFVTPTPNKLILDAVSGGEIIIPIDGDDKFEMIGTLIDLVKYLEV